MTNLQFTQTKTLLFEVSDEFNKHLINHTNILP